MLLYAFLLGSYNRFERINRTGDNQMSKGQRVGYIRVSTADQNTARQLADIQVDRTFTDHASGKDKERPALSDMLAYVREGDTLFVHSIDRLARNTSHLLEIVNALNTRGVSVEFPNNNLKFIAGATDAQATLMLTMLGAFAAFEKAMIDERRDEGIAIAKALGKYKGKAPKLKQPEVDALLARVAAGENKAEVARSLGISRSTLYTYLSASENGLVHL